MSAQSDPGSGAESGHTKVINPSVATQGADSKLTQIGCKLFEPTAGASKLATGRFQTIAEKVAGTDLSAFFDRERAKAHPFTGGSERHSSQ